MRNGETKTLNIKLGELPEEDTQIASSEPKTSENNKLNIIVSDIDASIRDKLDIKENGVLVMKIGPGPAKKAGIRRGDVILMVNNVDINNTNQFKEIVDDLPADKSVPMLIQGRGGPVFLALKLVDD